MGVAERNEILVSKLKQEGLQTETALVLSDRVEGRQGVYRNGAQGEVTSEVWDMEVLGALLSSCVSMFFMRAYSVKMRGDFVRFQAQNLRRLRLPAPTSLTDDHCAALATAFRAQDRAEMDRLACKAYGLSEAEMGIVLANQ